MTHQKRTQAEIANVANVTEVTIRNRYKELKNVLDLDTYKNNFELAQTNIEMDINN